MHTPLKLRTVGLLVSWIASASLLHAQVPSPELVVQRADTGFCERTAFSHDGKLLATDNGDEVLLWEVSSGRLLNTMKPYVSPEIQHMRTGAIRFGYERARGTLVFSPDDNTLGMLPVDFENPLNFGPQGAAPLLWNVDKGLPLTTGQWNLDGGFAVNKAAPSTPEVESWAISENREALTKVLEKGIKLESVSANGTIGVSRNDEPRNQRHIQLVDLKTGEVLRTLDATFEDVLAMALSPDGRYLAAHASNRRFVTVWDAASGKEVTEINHQDAKYAPGVGHMSFSPDGKWLAVQYGHEVDLFATTTWKPTISAKMEFRSLLHGQLAFSPDSKMLAIAGQSVRLINVDSGESIGTVCSSPLQPLRTVLWSESDTLAAATNKFARIWRAGQDMAATVLTSQGTLRALATSADDRFIALGSRDTQFGNRGDDVYFGDTRLWQIRVDLKEVPATGSPFTLSTDSSDGSSNSLSFSPDGSKLASAMLYEYQCSKHGEVCESDATSLGLLTLWDTTTGKLLRERKQPDQELNVVTFSRDGSQIATAHQNDIVKIYDTTMLNRTQVFQSPEKEAPFGISDPGTSALAYSPDGKLLLAGSNYGLIWLLDASGKNPARILREAKLLDQTKAEYEVPSGAIVSVSFSRDGTRIYAVESTGTVWLWNTTDWSSSRNYQTEAGASSAALSPNGKVLAIANSDGAIRFYGAGTGELKLTVASTGDADSGLAVSTDGAYDFGTAGDLSLALYQVGRRTVTVDRLPGNRRVQGLLNEVLMENAKPKNDTE